MKKIIAVLIVTLLVFMSCKEVKSEVEGSKSIQKATIEAVSETPELPVKADTLNWDEIPISSANLGQFPYFNPPKGFEFDEQNMLDFSKLIYYIKDRAHSFEGKTFTTRFATSQDKNYNRPAWNQVLFDKSYDDFIKSKGGVLVFKGKIPNDTLSKIGAIEVGKYVVGDVYNQPIKIYAIHQPDNKVLLQLTSSTAGASMGITSIEDFEQTITLVDSESIKKELDELGHIALYINFETGKSRIKADSYQIVSEIVKMLESHPDLSIIIEGHTDDVGDEASNQQLSENRAKSVVLALTDEGISLSRLKSLGYGESKPIENNVEESGKAKNRRVEIRKQ